jgi:prepilin-type N-terminal cleavage/methylation domain-containing protein
MKQNLKRNAAFSLVELSIVLVIIGLLVGGVLAGKSLIRSAELRSVTTEADKLMTAIGIFRNQYRYLPGDILNASNHWPGETNGNGNGIIEAFERALIWRHLYLGGYLPIPFTGIAGTIVPDVNFPGTKIKNTAFFLMYHITGTLGGSSYLSLYPAAHYMLVGRAVMASVNSSFLTPTDALYVDTKADDGKPGLGKWIASGTPATPYGSANSCTLASSNTDYTSDYKLTQDTISCHFYIRIGF